MASYLELMKVPYTGCNPRGLMLARGKDLSKTLVHITAIPTPAFAVFPMRRKVKRPTRLALPLIVKSLNEDASFGISQASIVDTRREAGRTGRLHPRAGRLRRHRRAVHRGARAVCRRARQRPAARAAGLGVEIRRAWRRAARPIATEKVKHDTDYQEKDGIVDGPAKDLAPEVTARIQRRPNASTARLTSTAMRASISVSRPTARRISSKPTPIRKSPRARSSPRRLNMTGSNTGSSCSAS